MGNRIYPFKVGALDCTIVSDGGFTYHDPASIFFVNAPQEELAEALGQHNLDLAQWHEYDSPYPALLVNTGQNRVLIDAGAGSMAPTTGKLIPNLRAAGIEPEEIDTVVITHAHPDHVGGAIDQAGQPTFPKARYVLCKDEWEFWTSEPDLSPLPVADYIRDLILSCARNVLPAIRDQVDVIDAEAEIVPGIQAMAAPGHTPGHMAVVVSSGGEELICPADAAIHPLHLEQPSWYAAVDLLPGQGLTSRRRVLERAAANRSLVHAFHFPWPGLGHVVAKGTAWQWQPIEAQR